MLAGTNQVCTLEMTTRAEFLCLSDPYADVVAMRSLRVQACQQLLFQIGAIKRLTNGYWVLFVEAWRL
jgi:hypothetical protein